MATMFYDKDADIELIRRRKVAVIGYGSQGHAHALNLQDSGVEVVVGLPSSSRSIEKAKTDGLKVMSVADASKWADVIMVLIPDTRQAKVYENDIKPGLTAGKMLMFAHGFNIRFNCIVPPKDVDVTMVAPKGPGHRVRGHSRAARGAPGRDGPGPCDGARLCPRHRLHARRRHRDDVLGGDRDRSVR
jgi:ketol-acid reductoisomerase